jgi:hypothetical protein
MKWFGRILLIAVVGVLGYAAYDYYKAGLLTRPEMPEGAFSLSFSDGPRYIVEGIPDERFERTYIARFPKNIPPWFKDSWSYCRQPTEDEAKAINDARNPGPGMRLDAKCELNADGTIIPTGYVYSVPTL